MIEWNIYINDTEVDEPQGWAEVSLNVTRDDQWHGVFFEASSSTLTFYGAGAEMLRAEKRANGLAAAATFRAEAVCVETVDILEGSFDFGTYIEKCGDTCTVQIAIERKGCLMTLRNRYDQRVDTDSNIAFDKMTLLEEYAGLNVELELPAQQIFLGNEAEMGEAAITDVVSDNPNWTDSDGFNNYIGWISPPFPEVTNASFGEFNTTPLIDLAGPLEGVPNRPPYPSFPTATGTATLLGDITCALEDTVLEFRLKGNGSVVFSGSAGVGLTTKIFRLPAGLDGTVAVNWIEEYAVLLWGRFTTGSDDFDTGVVQVPLTVNQGDFIYFGLSTRGDSLENIDNFTLRFDVESYFKLTTASTCEDSTAQTSLIHEIGSRVIESITDRCLTMKSNYYGRTDSQPYATDYDGCGSLRVLSNGLKIRNADPSNHFLSLEEFFTGLRGIDNIGMGVENNPDIPGQEWVRVEPVEYFYQNERILTLPYIPEGTGRLEPTMGYSKIQIGYKKWEVESVNGLNEFNSNKEFRTSLSTINNTLDATSNFVAGGIPIEITRQQSFAVTGSADTTYDNETFIICVERMGYGYTPEKGNITSPANIFSPATVYNWRIRPFYNLMRWFKSVAQSYVNLSNSSSKLFFSSGTGNYIAEGRLATPDPCDLENKVLAENDDLTKDDYIGLGGVPIYKAETVQFDYPLSIADYLSIKANPYGYIEYQCGTGIYEKGFIKSLEYKPVQGQATFTLMKKWL